MEIKLYLDLFQIIFEESKYRIKIYILKKCLLKRLKAGAFKDQKNASFSAQTCLLLLWASWQPCYLQVSNHVTTFTSLLKVFNNFANLHRCELSTHVSLHQVDDFPFLQVVGEATFQQKQLGSLKFCCLFL